MKINFRYIGVIFLITSVFIFGLAGGVMLDRFVMVAAASPNADSAPNLDLLLDAWRVIDTHYVDRDALTEERLTYGAISGMTEALGDTGHTTFLSPRMLTQHQGYTRGEFEGIGAQVEQQGDYIIITAPMDDSPALKAGLKPGDMILRVNGEDMKGKSVEYVIDKIIGPAGTQVTLTIRDAQNGTERELTLTRAKIKVSDVSWAKVPGSNVAVVRITGFSEGVSKGLKDALEQIKEQQVAGVILDLRNNPGGLLSEAVTTASQFLDEGNVLLEKDANGQIHEVQVEAGGVAPEIPMTVLINYGSASASEIVAGALQDSERGKLVGETTYGTGTVLNTFPLSDGSALLLATLEWLTPDGRVIWHSGIAPDDRVALPAGVMPLTPPMLKTMDERTYRASRDLQMQRAVEMLTCPAGNCPTDVNKFPGKEN